MNIKISIIGFIFFVMVTSVHSQSGREQLNQLVTQLNGRPEDTHVHVKIIVLARSIKPAMAIPEEARRANVQGGTVLESARTAVDKQTAIDLFKRAVLLAPWWGEACFNLGVAQARAGQLARAQISLSMYLLTNPDESDRRQALDTIYSMEKREDILKAEVAGGYRNAEEFWDAIEGATFDCGESDNTDLYHLRIFGRRLGYIFIPYAVPKSGELFYAKPAWPDVRREGFSYVSFRDPSYKYVVSPENITWSRSKSAPPKICPRIRYYSN